MSDTSIALFITSLATLAKLFWSDWQADRRAMRERAWQIEDRRAVASTLATKVEDAAAFVADRTTKANVAGAAVVKGHTDALSEQLVEVQRSLQENTVLTSVVGDVVGEKIEKLGQTLTGGK